METTSKLNEYVGLAYKEAAEIIGKAQGKKGYIDTQAEGKDKMYFSAYSGDYETATCEGMITGIRVRNDDIEIVGTTNFYGSVRVFFDEASFDKAARNYENDKIDECNWEDCWQPIRYSEVIHFIPTLFSIIESIEQYCD